jgi:hypothetical protein
MSDKLQAKTQPNPSNVLKVNRTLQRKCVCGGTLGPTGECESCRKKTLQRRSENLDPSSISNPPISVSDVPPIVHEVLRSSGQPLDAQTRAFMEPRLGHNFSRVRVRPDAPATGALTVLPSTDRSELEADNVARRAVESTFVARAGVSDCDFRQVRVHLDRKAAASAEAVNASAFTVGKDVVFAAGMYQPTSSTGRKLIAHELTHVLQQEGESFPIVQRFTPEGASVEMIGKTFLLNKAVTTSGMTLPEGSSVVITAWSNAATSITADFKSGRQTTSVTIGKQHLVPQSKSTSGLFQYHAGVTREARKFSALETKIDAQQKVISNWKLKQGDFKTEKGLKEWKRQMTVHETELRDLKYKLTGEGYTDATLPDRLKTMNEDKKMVPITPERVLLNRALIEETMFNAFDARIAKWVDFYNTSIGSPKKWPALDANLVKSMLYQESHMGTQGDFLILPPYAKGQRMTRFNIGQAIDSSGPQQILMIKELSPAIATKHKLDQVSKDAAAAQVRREVLVKKGATVGVTEEAELNEINARSKDGTRWNDFFTSDPRWIAAVEEFFTETVKARNLDYDFWIQTAVRWLFAKREGSSSWPAAIEAYNGSGDKAIAYKKDVIGRRDAAKAVPTDFVPRQHY